MRGHKQHVVYQSILPVLHEPGCPFCRFLREFQADRLQKHEEGELHHLCNFHVWGLAAVQEAPVAARIFLRLVNEAAPLSNGSAACDICSELLREEELRIREFLSCLHRAEVTQWLRASGNLCIPHGLKLRPGLPPAFVPRIDTMMEAYRQELSADLQHLRDEWLPESNQVGWGAAGRAAEFLVSQRGLRPQGKEFDMLNAGRAEKVSIYLSEGSTHPGVSTYSRILNFLFFRGVSGATVLKGVAGFGADHHMHSSGFVEISDHLPQKLSLSNPGRKSTSCSGNSKSLPVPA